VLLSQYFGPKIHRSPRLRTGPFHRVPSNWVAKMVAGRHAGRGENY
jgi:hypothetical protein